MAGIKALRKIQIGAEATAGTAVAATTIWRGVGTIQDNRVTNFPEEDIGILPGTDRTYVSKYEALLSLGETPATYEQIAYLGEMGIESVTATTDTSGYLYTYTMPIETSDINTATELGTYTFEGGDNENVEAFAYGFLTSFQLSGTAGEALMMSGEVVGRQVSTDNFTTDLSIPSVEEILFSKGVLYIDDTSTYPATTQVSNTLLDATLSVNTGWTPVYTADGNLYFSFVKQAPPEVTLTVTFEYNSSSVGEVANWRSETARSIRLYFVGSSAAKKLYLDLVGKWDNFGPIGERDGNDIVEGTFRARYNSTAAAFFRMIVYNNLASLT